MSDFLTKILNSSKSKKEVYLSYFQKEVWTISEFTSLVAGLSPEEFYEIHDDKNEIVYKKQFEKYCYANKIFKQFIKGLNKDITSEKIHSNGNELFLTLYQYVKWLAENQIPMKKIFAKALPLYLHEVFLEFQPLEKTIKTKPQWERDFHEAIYLKNAEQLMNKSKKKLTRKDIYDHPQMKWIKMTFKNKKGTQKKYSKRTIIDSWLPKIDPKKRGRPRKKPLKIK